MVADDEHNDIDGQCDTQADSRKVIVMFRILGGTDTQGIGNCNVLPANVIKCFLVKLFELLLGKDYRARSFTFPKSKNFCVIMR